MRRTAFTITLFIALSLGVAAQNTLKRSVGVVRPYNDKNTEAFFKNYASVLYRQGYKEAAKYVSTIGGRSFGSCFVVRGNDGHYYAITNRHAVEFADSAMVQFIEGRDTVTYDGLRIAKVSEELDLAAILLPDGGAFTPLTITDRKIEDGAEVFTAGFPGISGKPSWQFGKGIVSNSQFYNDLLTNDSNRWVIQHTAQIDAGSSGGPLLVKEDDAYRVAGVNTWKVSNRNEMNLAICSQDLRQFLTETKTMTMTMTELNNLYQQIEADIHKSYRNILPHLSYTYMFYMTTNEIDRSFSNMPKVLREDIDKLMRIGHFTEALRLLSAYSAARQIVDNPFTFESFTPVETHCRASQTATNEVILNGANRMEVVFVWEKSAWRITKVGRNSSRKQTAANATEAYGVGITNRLRGTIISGNVAFPVAGNIVSQTDIGGCLSFGWVNRFIMYEGVLDYFRFKANHYLGVAFRIGGLLPIQLSPHVIISPNIKLEVGSDLAVGNASNDYSNLFVGGIGGVDLIFKFGKSSTYMLVGASYEHRGLFYVFKKNNNQIDNIGYVGAHIGFIF